MRNNLRYKCYGFAALVLFFLGSPLPVLAACPLNQVYADDMVLNSQQDVDALAQNPFTHLAGDMTIAGADISNLDSLVCLRHVDGTLIIESNSSLPSLAGLEQLKEVTGTLSVRNNPILSSIAALANLKNVGGLELYSLPALTDITEMEKLRAAPMGIFIGSNHSLERLHLPGLEVVSWYLIIDSNENLVEVLLANLKALNDSGLLMINKNPKLQALDLSSLEKITGGFHYTNNASLKVLELMALKEIQGSIRIAKNKYLEAVDMSKIEDAGELEFTLYRNPLLKIAHFSSLQTLTNLIVERNDKLGAFDMPSVTRVNEDLIVTRNGAMERVDLQNLAAVGLSFIVEHHPRLAEFKLGEFIELGDDIDNTQNDYIIRNNPLLQSCRFVEIAARFGLWGHNNSNSTPNEIDVSHNDDSGMEEELLASSQQELEQFNGVKCVAGHVRLDNGSFTDVTSPLQESRFVGGKFGLYYSTLPEKIELPQLRYNGDYLDIIDNAGLRELRVPMLERLSDIWVQSNDVLTIRAPELRDVNRHFVIYMNSDYRELAFNSLDRVGNGIMILENLMLPHTQVIGMLNQMSSIPAWLVVCNNLTGPLCP